MKARAFEYWCKGPLAPVFEGPLKQAQQPHPQKKFNSTTKVPWHGRKTVGTLAGPFYMAIQSPLEKHTHTIDSPSAHAATPNAFKHAFESK